MDDAIRQTALLIGLEAQRGIEAVAEIRRHLESDGSPFDFILVAFFQVRCDAIVDSLQDIADQFAAATRR